ncbi:hypothetical protein F7725_004092 [Dissostichus mawsoni]|uniref:Uncharacterized protein n=1 Tax=Dissostichus mawsoni TaxID=36200 RepID=A0A7J5YC34_DISMA|nr:hypothetical protein F7725_004092 [Dissostichus mawsoni]
MSSTKTLLHRDPFGVHSTFYAARCSALSVLLLMLFVVDERCQCLHNTHEETSEQNGGSLRALRPAVCSQLTTWMSSGSDGIIDMNRKYGPEFLGTIRHQ